MVRYDLKLPEREELRVVLETVLRSLTEANWVKIQLDNAGMEELVSALAGMTLNQARQTIAFAALKDGRFSSEAVKDILERKAQVIRESGLLEYFQVEDNRFQLGGFHTLKQWLERAQTGFSKEARELNLPAPRGILIVGIQGCGKSLSAKVIARQWKLPLLKLDAGRLFDKFIWRIGKEPAPGDSSGRVHGSGCFVDRRNREGHVRGRRGCGRRSESSPVWDVSDLAPEKAPGGVRRGHRQ